MQIDVRFLLQVLPTAIIQGTFVTHSNFCVDTRNLQKGDVFIALKGERVDGHDFISQAFLQGASGIIADKKHQTVLMKKYEQELKHGCIIFVDNTLQALIQLAYAWRSNFTFPVVAITGTVGKTTTKEMVKNILQETEKKFLVSSGNQNTIIGVALNILKMRQDHQVAIFELGISEIGAMKTMVELLRPTYAAITCIGHGHLEGLGTLAQVSHEKREIFAMFNQANIGVINGDQKELSEISYPFPVIRFGKKTTNQIQARKITIQNNSVHFFAKIYQKKYEIVLPYCNQAYVTNALAALCIGKLLKIDDELLIAGICKPVNISGRFEVLPHICGSVLINDGYNANPESVKASIDAFEHYQTNLKKVLVLGDMMELGEQSIFWHRQLGRMASKISNLESVVLIGSQVAVAKKTLPIGTSCTIFANIDDAFDYVKSMLLQKDKVLLCKASNSLRFSELINKLQKA